MHERVFSDNGPSVVLIMQKAKNCTASHKERGTMSESKTSRVRHPCSLHITIMLHVEIASENDI